MSNLAEVATSLTSVGGSYEFESGLIADQINAIERRIDLDNQYVFRYAFLPRIGEHTSVFSSNATGYNFSLTMKFTEEYMKENENVVTPGELSSQVEIAGPNGEFISGNDLAFSEAQTFLPTTRWTNETYTAADYSWSISNGTGVANANGTFTVTSISGGSATLTLTNTARAAPESVSIEITD